MSLQRKTPLKRSPMKRKTVKRDWSLAESKRGPCRAVGRGPCAGPIELAHSVGRRFQDIPKTNGALLVVPDSVLPLCSTHHRLYDGRRMSILGLLTMAELRNAVAACKRAGLDARRRLSGGRG